MRDITERKAFEHQLQQHAFYDSVTGLPNRTLFRNRVNHALANAKRSGDSVAAMFMDLDDFKVINDSFGHATGDAVLRAVAQRLTACLRDGDTIARLGGDEFAILLEETTDVAPVALGNRIMGVLEAPFRIEGKEIHARASLGIAFANGKTGDAATDELLRNADVAMYVAKGAGKSRCEVYHATTHMQVMLQLEMKSDLKRALSNGEFILHYQPLVTLETERISGLEALIRWEHPERGTIPPLDFIPLAEESGLILALGRWVLRRACQEARRLQDKFAEDPPLTMAVNLSALQLQSPTIVADVREALEASRLAPGSLTLEVTESAMMLDIEMSVLRLQELRDLGVRIAIDDFGAGYSSLAYIRRFPIDVLKVDKSFIDRIDEGAEARARRRDHRHGEGAQPEPGRGRRRADRAVPAPARARLRQRAGLLLREAGDERRGRPPARGRARRCAARRLERLRFTRGSAVCCGRSRRSGRRRGASPPRRSSRRPPRARAARPGRPCRF